MKRSIPRVRQVDVALADPSDRLLPEIGMSVLTIDSLLAGTALYHELLLVTRNERKGISTIRAWM